MTDAQIRAGTNHFPRAAAAAADAIRKVRSQFPTARPNCPSGWMEKTILEAMRQTAAGKAISVAAIAAAAEGAYCLERWARQRPTGTAVHP